MRFTSHWRTAPREERPAASKSHRESQRRIADAISKFAGTVGQVWDAPSTNGRGMPNPVRTLTTRPASPEVIITSAFGIQQDFRALVEALSHVIEMVDPADEELQQRLANTKAAADRGLRLSKLLLRASRKRWA
jgi:hypothetical protein